MATSARWPAAEQRLPDQLFDCDYLLREPLVARELLDKRKNNRNISFGRGFDFKSRSAHRDHDLFAARSKCIDQLDDSAFCCFNARQTRSGVRGRSFMRTPVARAKAFVAEGATDRSPPSPIPRTP